MKNVRVKKAAIRSKSAKTRKTGDSKGKLSQKKRQTGIKRRTMGGPRELVLPKRIPVESKSVIVVYGMKVDPEHITRAAVEAFNKRRYTVHDLRLTDYIPDPRFRNLMVKISVLDRIEEELLRIYPDANVIRPNTVTLMVR